jgi:V/A-type H+-transporting ATPase subunit D
MANVKLTKTELKAQSDALKRFQRFLPMLQLKKQQLQGVIAGISAKVAEVREKEAALKSSMGSWAGLLATRPELVEGLVTLEKINSSTANIAGVALPTFESVETKTALIDMWETPAWVDDAAAAARECISLQCEREVFEEQLRLVSHELQQTSQRVNLFEKVKIPQCKEAIRKIKIAIGDEQTAAVTRGKIAKSRSPAQGGGEGEDAA